MRKIQHIPTIVALLLLLLGMGSVVFLVEKTQSLFTQASTEQVPQNVTASNISDHAFSISWNTTDATRGTVRYKEEDSNTTFTALDDRDSTTPGKYFTHHVTIRNTKPNTRYVYSILSDDKEYDSLNSNPYTAQTTNPISLESNTIPPMYGTVKHSDDRPASDTLVYITPGSGQLISTVTKIDGQFFAALNPLYDQSLQNTYTITDDTLIHVVFRGARESSNVETVLKNTTPLPTVTLGKTYDFRVMIPQKLRLAYEKINTLFSQIISMIIKPALAAAPIQILQPEEGAGIPSQTPLFKGTGVKNKQVIATVGNPPQVGKVWVDTKGNWSWQPPQKLAPQSYVLTITTYNESDEPVALARQFTILKSGASVLQAATPSASTPTPIPTQTPIPTIAPIVTVTPTSTLSASVSSEGIPVSGNVAMTLAISFLGFLLLTTGVAFSITSSHKN